MAKDKLIKATYKVQANTHQEVMKIHDWLLSLGCQERQPWANWGGLDGAAYFYVCFKEEQMEDIYPQIKDNVIWMDK